MATQAFPREDPPLRPGRESYEEPWDILTTLRWDPSLSSRMATQLCYPEHIRDANETDLTQVSHFYMLPYHRDRMLSAARAFDRPFPNIYEGNDGLRHLEEVLQQETRVAEQCLESQDIRRVRVLLSPKGEISVTSTAMQSSFGYYLYPTPSILGYSNPVYRIFISPEATERSLHTAHKTTLRSHYDHIRSLLPSWTTNPRTNGDLVPEILLINQDGEIMEGTFTTPYFALRNPAYNAKVSYCTPRAEAGGNLGTTRRWALESDWCEEACINKDDRLVSVGERVWLSNGARGWGLGRIEAWSDRIG